ncbi:MAG: WD40 repeat domain-containing protein [Ignavibacterium sp.]|jgi:WD40 repeat protein|nr:WD40 repeat domain-containing protein [Ignavibacterium sp.]MDD5608066.1 WD40 repeat domain-containing protein [Ignavibacterium sp.]MDT3696458.1 WD40 repeat domain-containing protein [Ignavibacterium sp.]MDX9711797.1 WD40 repeat domain-containing protein [Ignavibacteriaceae bacterium]GIK21168.1 MAG: hypothetical protein BroJett005_05820 [Ignavibacteriota bacterium]
MLYAIFFILLIMVGDVYDGSFVGHYPSVGKNKLTSNDTSIYNSDSLRADMNSNHLSFLHILNKRSEIIAEPVSDDIKGGTIYRWNLFDGKRSILAYLGDRVWIAYMTVSHNEDFIVVATLDNDPTRLKYFSIKEKKWLWEIQDLDHYWWLGFSDNDKEIIAFGNNAVYRVNAYNGVILSKTKAIHNEYSLSVHKSTGTFISPTGKYLVIWQVQETWALLDLFRRSANKNISVWDIEEEKIVASMSLPEKGVRTATFTSDEKNVFLGCGDETIKLWSLEKNKIVNEIPGLATYLVTSNKQNFLASGIMEEDRLSKVKIWKYPEMTLIHTIEPYSKNYINRGRMPVNFDKTGKYFGVERDGKLYLYDTSNWEVLWSFNTDVSDSKQNSEK